jgi:two-component system OmpR family response regulator
MIWDPSIQTKVFVVDASLEDYEFLAAEIGQGSLDVAFFTNGRDALRAASDEAPTMWIVNMRLPDMDGTELQAILRTSGCKATIALVGNEYKVEEEIEARCAGADMYFAKPLHRDLVCAAR